ncbi:MAG: basic amino acid ABC transporter substrate-binding protein [Anaerolineae bacterium]|nr:basic amino acid ABC transporter substrate-binding protein [Anaerolineae bacterium]
MKKTLVVVCSVLILAAVVLSACGAKTEKVTVATDATFPPFETVDEATKELTGFDVELMNAIAEKAGMEIEWVNTPFDSVVAGVSECQYDMAIAAITITEERQATMLFSDPYVDAGQIVVVRIDETAIAGKDDLSGKVVAAQLGTTGEIEAQAIEGVEYKPYDTYDLAMLDLINGQVDAVIADKPTADAFVGQYADKLMTVGDPFTEEKYGIAFCKDKADLQAKVNEALGTLVADGTVGGLITKWLAPVVAE